MKPLQDRPCRFVELYDCYWGKNSAMHGTTASITLPAQHNPARQCPKIMPTLAGASAERISRWAVGGIYLLAGVPETVELCLNVAGGLVDTHVLMTLAALGLLALSQASEVHQQPHTAFPLLQNSSTQGCVPCSLPCRLQCGPPEARQKRDWRT